MRQIEMKAEEQSQIEFSDKSCNNMDIDKTVAGLLTTLRQCLSRAVLGVTAGLSV